MAWMNEDSQGFVTEGGYLTMGAFLLLGASVYAAYQEEKMCLRAEEDEAWAEKSGDPNTVSSAPAVHRKRNSSIVTFDRFHSESHANAGTGGSGEHLFDPFFNSPTRQGSALEDLKDLANIAQEKAEQLAQPLIEARRQIQEHIDEKAEQLAQPLNEARQQLQAHLDAVHNQVRAQIDAAASHQIDVQYQTPSNGGSSPGLFASAAATEGNDGGPAIEGREHAVRSGCFRCTAPLR
eukprot:TRINITY_DN63885_c0_g1_i1.p1 TRINITY_DN63885_c0_g1~~TRINITY_DN63885_c0_g1_i1.p1  ORF type:complete len:271 (-),score=50.64 TRINITY_DN63885_c0_g1_i1:103-810(-)